MKTVKEILSENRSSIISTIKYHSKLYKKEDIKARMVDFLNWAEANPERIMYAYNSTRTKTLLKSFYLEMRYRQTVEERVIKKAQEEAENIRIYGKASPNLRDIIAKRAERYEEQGRFYDFIKKDYVRK